MLTLRNLALALRGEVVGNQVLCAGPGHSPRDRSLSIKLARDDPAGFKVHSFAGDDFKACRDHVKRALGLRDIVEGPGTAAALAEAIIGWAPRDAGPILSIGAEVQAFDMGAALAGAGLPVTVVTAYRMMAAEKLNPDTLDALGTGALDGVLLLSQRTAATYADLVILHNQLRNIRKLVHYCLSPGVAAPLAALAPGDVRMARRPTVDALLSLVMAGSQSSP